MTFKTSDERVKEMLISLRPVLGNQEADRIWQTYCFSDEKMKGELEEIINLMVYRDLDHGLTSEANFFSPPPKDMAAGRYCLGDVIYGGHAIYPFGLHDKEIGEHICITGRSGAAKSTALFHIIQELLEKSPGVKILAFDWKRELRALTLHPTCAKSIDVYTVGREDISPLRFNPLIPPPGTTITNHLEQLLDIICRCFFAGEGVFDILTRAIDACYRDFKVYDGKTTQYPTFRDVHNKIESYDLKGRQNEWKSSALRITRALGFGEFGKVVNTPQNALEGILERNVVLELDSLPLAKRAFFVSTLLAWLYNYSLARRTNEPDYGKKLTRVIAIEEAHHVAMKHATSPRESILEMMIRQARFLGLGMILVDQTPSMLSSTVMANVHTSISLNQKNSADISAVAGNLLLDETQRSWLSMLRVGEAIVRLSDRFLTPFMIKTRIVPIKEQTVTDAAVRGHMASVGRGYFASSRPEGAPISVIASDSATDKISEEEIRLLKDIIEHPFIGVAKRYKRLYLSARKGNELKEALLKRGILEAEEVNTGSAMLMLLKPTAAGLHIAGAAGAAAKRLDYRASLEHEYWRHKAANYCRALGYKVSFEVLINGKADIIAQKGDFAIAIEIETGRNSIQSAVNNIRKNMDKGFERVISLVSDTAFLARLEANLKESGLYDERVKVMPSSQFCSGRSRQPASDSAKSN